VRYLLLLLLAMGCAKRSDSAMSSDYGEPFSGLAYDEYDASGAYEAAPASASRSERAPAPKAASRPAPSPVADGRVAMDKAPEPAPPSPAARMVHYDGFARVRVTRVDEALDAVAKLAEGLGGRVERLSASDISVRVPAATFDQAFAAVLELGDVLDRTVRADDITEQFTAVDLRVKTLRATRDRLIALLAKATEENEKLLLLREITRVTEELDQLESQLRTLSDLAGMARISVQAVPREAFRGAGGPDVAGFEWIRRLSPFNRGVFDDDRRVDLPEAAGLVALSKKGPYIAESADGTVVWTLRRPNDPEGDATFWIASVEDRLSEDFAAVTRLEAGLFTCLVLHQAGVEEPYQWRICAQPVGKHLHVAQVYFPSAAQVERYESGVMAAIAGGSR
jgi:hypothetical protein